jgi:benzoyl-CoA 2,3-dioxygenase component B
MKKIATFDDWIDQFRTWQKDINLQLPKYSDYDFEAKYGELRTDEIEYGDFRGQKKWERVTQIPQQQIRDALLNLIVYQGDTEFASVEQQRYLFETAPSDYDRSSLTRVMIEEMRHGWQMCALLIEHFGATGKVEAQKMLERKAYENKRLLGSFNEECDNWLDFFAFTDFIDRDGKFQLQMLKYSAFAPLGRSMSYMLREEAFHMGTGNTGLARIAQAGVVPGWLMQKYLNKWISSAYDLFGTDHSSSAHWAYTWGLKGRYDELKNQADPDLDNLNDYNRHLYRDECVDLVKKISAAQRPGSTELYCPDIKFNRMIGRWKGQYFHPQTGQQLEEKEYKQQFETWMPTPADKKLLMDIIGTEKKWIAPKAGAKDPLLTIGEVRKSALNAVQ